MHLFLLISASIIIISELCERFTKRTSDLFDLKDFKYCMKHGHPMGFFTVFDAKQHDFEKKSSKIAQINKYLAEFGYKERLTIEQNYTKDELNNLLSECKKAHVKQLKGIVQ